MEKLNREFQTGDSSITRFVNEEKGNFTFIGEVFDTIYHADGRVEKRDASYNIVVDSVSKLISALIKNETAYTTGELYWAVGTGDVYWDTVPYSPLGTNVSLVNEVFRKTVTSRTFIDVEGKPTEQATNRIQLNITIDSGEANGYSLREFGIFGGNVTITPNSGIMINHKVHSRIDKEEGMIIERSVRFTF